MHAPLSSFRPPPAPEPPADVRSVTVADVTWNRPIFKAPPLKPVFDATIFAEDLRRIGLVSR
ncbi:MAG TPA: hypothetical protein VHD62_03400 [Opitutaceae bacterium]|nr:hypothetical protein [Opitutaceae bacterium]